MTAYFYYELPVYSIFLNLCILPFLSPLLGLGLIAGMVSESSMTLAKALLYPCHLILYGYEVLCDLSLSWPGARQILGEPSAAVLIFYYFCLFAALYLFSGRTSLLSGKGGWPAKNGWRGMLLGHGPDRTVLAASCCLRTGYSGCGAGRRNIYSEP